MMESTKEPLSGFLFIYFNHFTNKTTLIKQYHQNNQAVHLFYFFA